MSLQKTSCLLNCLHQFEHHQLVNVAVVAVVVVVFVLMSSWYLYMPAGRLAGSVVFVVGKNNDDGDDSVSDNGDVGCLIYVCRTPIDAFS